MNYIIEMGAWKIKELKKDCIKKHETCGHRDWDGKCTIHGCIINYNRSLMDTKKFYFGVKHDS
jgi:hypothetical protein